MISCVYYYCHDCMQCLIPLGNNIIEVNTAFEYRVKISGHYSMRKYPTKKIHKYQYFWGSTYTVLTAWVVHYIALITGNWGRKSTEVFKLSEPYSRMQLDLVEHSMEVDMKKRSLAAFFAFQLLCLCERQWLSSEAISSKN